MAIITDLLQRRADSGLSLCTILSSGSGTILGRRSSACSTFQRLIFQIWHMKQCRSDCLLTCDEFEDQSITIAIRLISNDPFLRSGIGQSNCSPYFDRFQSCPTLSVSWTTRPFAISCLKWHFALLWHLCSGILSDPAVCPFFSSFLSAPPLLPPSSLFDAVCCILPHLHSFWAILLLLFTCQTLWGLKSYTSLSSLLLLYETSDPAHLAAILHNCCRLLYFLDNAEHRGWCGHLVYLEQIELLYLSCQLFFPHHSLISLAIKPCCITPDQC